MTPWIRNRLAFQEAVDLGRVREALAPWWAKEPWAFKGFWLEEGRPTVVLRTEWCPARAQAEALSKAFPDLDLELVYEDALSGCEGAEAYRNGELREVIYFDDRLPLPIPA